MNLLYIPLKQSKPIDLGHELGETIRKDYFQTVSTFEADLQQIALLRNEITALKNESPLLNALYKYYPLLATIREKFPDDCIAFGWYHSLTYGFNGPQNASSLRFEQLNIAFQIASVHSQLGWSQSKYSDDGLKVACTHFQKSAGCIDLIEKSIDSAKVIPVDFTPATLAALKYLMLAQAQEMIWHKAILNSAKDSVIAKLLREAEILYSAAHDHGTRSDFIKLEWINHLHVKKCHFGAAAHYRMSVVHQNQAQYGAQIASLRAAATLCTEALRSEKYVAQIVIDDLHGLKQTVGDTLRAAEKDNNFLYFQQVPAGATPVVPAPMVSPTVPEVLHEKESIFKELLPYVVMQVAQAFTERKADYVQRQFHVPVAALNTALVRFLTDSGLLAAIDSIQQPENLPESIVQHSRDITSVGGCSFIEATIDDVLRCAAQGKSLVDECVRRLDLERDEDARVSRAGSGRVPSAVAQRALREKTEKMRAYLEQARAGDRLVQEKYMQIKPVLEIYASFDSLLRHIPLLKHTPLDAGTSEVVSEMRSTVNEATNLRDARTKFLYDVDLRAKDNKILPEVVLAFRARSSEVFTSSGEVNQGLFEPVYEAHIAKCFAGDLSWLQQLREEQVKIQDMLVALHARFRDNYERVKSESQQKRQEVLQQLEQAYTKYVELMLNLKEGSVFYNDFMAKGNEVLRECDEFLYKRRLQARDEEQGSERVGRVSETDLLSPKPTRGWMEGE